MPLVFNLFNNGFKVDVVALGAWEEGLEPFDRLRCFQLLLQQLVPFASDRHLGVLGGMVVIRRLVPGLDRLVLDPSHGLSECDDVSIHCAQLSAYIGYHRVQPLEDIDGVL